MEQNTKKCPYCGEEVLAVAKKCRFCGEWLDKESTEQTSVHPEVPKQSHQRKPKTFLNKKRSLMVIIPMSAIVVFAIILLVFHLNYSYTDWWADEKEYRSMTNEEQGGVRQKIKRVEDGEARFEDWLKNYFQKLPRDKQRSLASYLGAMGSFGTIDEDLLKEAYGDVLVGNFKEYEKPGNEDFMASVLYGSSYYNSSERKKGYLRSNVGTVSKFMYENNQRKTGKAADSKISQIMKLQEDMADIEDKKLALTIKYNKIIEDAGDSLTLTQYWAIKDQANKEFEELLKSQETMQADIDSIISQAKKNVR